MTRRHSYPLQRWDLGRGKEKVLWAVGQAREPLGSGDAIGGARLASLPVADRLYVPREWAEHGGAEKQRRCA